MTLQNIYAEWSNSIKIPEKFLDERIIIIDLETNGLFEKGNHILEIAALEVKDGRLTGNQFNAFLKPRAKVAKEAFDLHGINEETYKDLHANNYKSDQAVMENFVLFVKDSIVFAHNAVFDRQFINRELRYWKLPIIEPSRFRCTKSIFFEKFIEPEINNLDNDNNFSLARKYSKNTSIKNCCDFLKIKIDSKRLHSALYDAIITFKILRAILDFDKISNSTYKINRNNNKSDDLYIANLHQAFEKESLFKIFR